MAHPGLVGVLLMQLGTPDAPTEEAVRRFLREFLSDRRVIDLPRLLWWPILHLSVLRKRPAQSARLVLAFSMYPQYASATVGSSLERLFDELKGRRRVPPVRVVPPFFDDPLYIDAVATGGRESLGALGWAPDHIVVSVHGLRARHAETGDPYPLHYVKTMELLASRLGWAPDFVRLSLGADGRHAAA